MGNPSGTPSPPCHDEEQRHERPDRHPGLRHHRLQGDRYELRPLRGIRLRRDLPDPRRHLGEGRRVERRGHRRLRGPAGRRGRPRRRRRGRFRAGRPGLSTTRTTSYFPRPGRADQLILAPCGPVRCLESGHDQHHRADTHSPR
ncbi:hypothetical protein SGPA1_30299 [Streptomyces misionensis JCM 4497]